MKKVGDILASALEIKAPVAPGNSCKRHHRTANPVVAGRHTNRLRRIVGQANVLRPVVFAYLLREFLRYPLE